jgi:hypothetical protein
MDLMDLNEISLGFHRGLMGFHWDFIGIYTTGFHRDFIRIS